ncbi:MAG: hypothetical protein JWN60_321 [Acidobacteria bacterium]|jgi:hypothetical protein|nr:hypothetical protein [Acidobacteriota bacterium]
MSTKGKIKVIKKGEIKNTEVKPQVEKNSKQEAARQMVSTVTNWVSDFQVRKREETKLAIEQFFSSRPQIGEI